MSIGDADDDVAMAADVRAKAAVRLDCAGGEANKTVETG